MKFHLLENHEMKTEYGYYKLNFNSMLRPLQLISKFNIAI